MRRSIRFGVWCALAGAMALPAPAQITQLICQPLADPLFVRSEGLTERTGTIVLTCQGTSGGIVDAGLIASVNHSVTNRLDENGNADVTVAAQTATGIEVVASSPRLVGNNQLVFEQFQFTMPADGESRITISNIRVALDGPDSTRPVAVTLSFNGRSGIFLSQATVTVGVPRRGLFASSTTARIVCLPSPVPEEVTFSGLLTAGTRFASLRVTEGEPTAFEPRRPGTANGVRIVIRYSGFPAGSRVWTPDVIAGSSATRQTAAGDMGIPASGGKYTPGDPGSLLLARVRFTDDSGAGGSLQFQPGPPGSPEVAFDSVSEVPLRNGSGLAVFEVVDGRPHSLESAQIPTWVSVPRPEVNTLVPVVASARISFGPLSTQAAASRQAPVVRFRDVEPKRDCDTLNDCNANYFPRLEVDAPALTFTGTAGVKGYYSKFIRVLNRSGGAMAWTATVQYRNGEGWLATSPPAGVNNASILLFAYPENVAPGSYDAVLTIDAGAAGTRTYPVTLTARDAPTVEPPPEPVVPRITNVTNAANTAVTILSPLALVSIWGERLAGDDVSVVVDGQPVEILFRSASQVNVILPDRLSQPRAGIQVRVDGVWSAPWGMIVAPAAPVVFARGVLNEDGSVNAVDNPERPGRILQVFLTGGHVMEPGGLTVKLHDREIEEPLYGGAAPGLRGIQQVNFWIPGDLPSMSSEMIICAQPERGAARACSQPVLVHLRR